LAVRNSIGIKREIADLVLEALDIAMSRKLTQHHTHAFVLEVIRAERPDLGHDQAHALVRRVWQRLTGPKPAVAPGE
jgi:hypothetical protein